MCQLKDNNECICTVLLISYNHAPYICRAIESVLCQKTEYKFKICIFDDASKDGTGDIIREYTEKYPQKITSFIAEENQGAQQNMWKAYSSVDTKYCCLLECDDYWCDEEKLQLQIDALEQNPDCSFCAHNTLYENGNDRFRKKEDGKLMVTNRNIRDTGTHEAEEFAVLYGAGWMNHVSSRLIRMSYVDLEGLTDKEDFLYDNAQFFYLIDRGKLYFIQRIMSVYYMNMSSSFTSLAVVDKIRGHGKRMFHINESTEHRYEKLIYRQVASFTRYWLALDDIDKGLLKDRNDIYYTFSRWFKSFRYDMILHYKLKKKAQKNIKLQNRRNVYGKRKQSN